MRVEPQTSLEGVPLLHISVRDSGIGIPVEKQQQIFEAFTQADGSTTRNYGGTGLGLTISKRIVGLMGGRIWVESEVGRGSTFHFTVRLESGELATNRSSPRSDKLAGLHVLVVDDNATSRELLRDTLMTWGMLAQTADCGAAALAALQCALAAKEPFDLLLLDVRMPE